MEMMIVPHKFHVVVMGQPNSFLAKWLQEKGYHWRVSPKAAFAVDADRNQACMHFLKKEAPKGRTHMIMLDHDMIPIKQEMSKLFHVQELSYLGFIGTSGVKGHLGDDDFGANAFCVSKEVLEKMPKPWFKCTYDENHCAKLDCECNHFHRQAQSVGVKAKQVGIVGHQQGGEGGCILLPTGGEGWGIMWPRDLIK